jgi:hypothetical protein
VVSNVCLKTGPHLFTELIALPPSAIRIEC